MNYLKFLGCFCLLLVFLVSCQEKNEETATPEPLYFPVSVTRAASYTADTTRSEFTYNPEYQVVEEKQFKNGRLEKVFSYTYNAAGKLIQKTAYNEKNELLERDSISYQPAQFTFRLNHGYYDASGKFLPHHLRLHQTDATGTVIKWEDFDATGKLLNSRNYQYSGSLLVRSAFYGDQHQHLNTSEITFDSRHTPFKDTGINLVPYPGNELSHEIKDPFGQVISAYSQAISYNEAGYPIKITQTHRDGTIKTETYTYIKK